MTGAEILAAIAGVLSVWLSIKRSPWAWVVGTVGVLAYAWLFWKGELWGNFGLQLVYILQNAYGFWSWTTQKNEQTETREDTLHLLDAEQAQPLETANARGVRALSTEEQWLLFALCVMLMGGILGAVVKRTDRWMSFWDWTSTLLSLLANWLLARKILETWLVWILTDTILLGLLVSQGLYLAAASYLLFLGLAVWGYMDWFKLIQKNAPNNQN
jgi:nicotinamide mononucleotide transporter